jgi:hypothetical protein
VAGDDDGTAGTRTDELMRRSLVESGAVSAD